MASTTLLEQASFKPRSNLNSSLVHQHMELNKNNTNEQAELVKVKIEEETEDKDFENFLVFQKVNSLNSTPTRTGDETDQQEADMENGLKTIQNAIFSYSQMKTESSVETSPCKSEDTETMTPVQPLAICPLKQDGEKATDSMTGFSGKLLLPIAQKPVVTPVGQTINSFCRRPADNNAIFPQRIVEECLAKRMNECERVNNLIQILKDFPEQNEANKDGKSQKLDVSRNVYKIDENAKKTLLAQMNQAIQCVSVVHSNYVKYVMGIAKDLPTGDSAEMDKKIEYLFYQLTLLKGVVLSIRNRIVSLEQTVRFINKQNAVKSEDVKIEETDCETPKLEHNVVSIKIESINPGFENIVKKRILG